MQTLDSIATAFYQSFYRQEWRGDGAAVTRLSIEEAYVVQDLVTRKRVASGEQVAGFKVGCTSRAIRAQFGLNEAINGKLFHPHIIDANVNIDWSNYINCAIEPEMILKIGKDLAGENLSDAALSDAIEYVSPGVEIHNFKFWITPPSIQELICSGGIHAGLVAGTPRVDPADLLFANEMFYVYKDNVLVSSAPGAEIMGGPLHALRWLVTFLTRKGLCLEKGSLVLPGSPVALVNIDQDTELKVIIDKVGEVTTMFEKK